MPVQSGSPARVWVSLEAEILQRKVHMGVNQQEAPHQNAEFHPNQAT